MANKKKNKNKNRKKKPPAAGNQAKKVVADTEEETAAATKKPTAPQKETVAAKKQTAAARKSTPAPKKKGLSANAQWGLIGLVGFAILGFFVLLPAITDAADDGGPGVVAAESFDLPVLDDQDNLDNRIRLADFEGTPTVVNFFASWCTACDEELPAFRETALALEGEVDFIFVNSNESGDWEPMAERNEIREGFPLAQDIQGLARNGLYRSLGGTGGMPITAFYDANGDLINTAFLPFNEAQLEAELARLGFTS